MSAANESDSGSSDGLHCSGPTGEARVDDFGVQGTPPLKLTGYGKKVILTSSGVSLLVGATHDVFVGIGIAILSVALDRSYWK